MSFEWLVNEYKMSSYDENLMKFLKNSTKLSVKKCTNDVSAFCFVLLWTRILEFLYSFSYSFSCHYRNVYPFACLQISIWTSFNIFLWYVLKLFIKWVKSCHERHFKNNFFFVKFILSFCLLCIDDVFPVKYFGRPLN